ncbi:MAG: hypothetical protein ACRC1H_11770, partial [Caldilineaceae bacterium]
MSLLDIHGEDLAAAAPLYRPPAEKPRRAWGTATAVFRGAGEGLTQIGATLGAVLSQGDSTGGMLPDLGRASRTADVDAARKFQREQDLEFIRAGGRSLRPDQSAGMAEQVLYGMARSVTKVVAGAVAGGVPGVLAVSAEEAFTQTGEARREGIDSRTAAGLGLVQGAGLALAALPAAGQTVAGTFGLYLAGGPGGFVAQQALTKEILDRAGYAERAKQVDVLDPVGLAVSALVPAPFAVLGLRAARNRRALESLPDLPTTPPQRGGEQGQQPSPEVQFTRTPTALAAEAYPREVTSAALVLNSRSVDAQAREAVAGQDMAAGRAHDAALARAEDQLQRGEPVSVADLAPAFRGVPEPDALSSLRLLELNRQALVAEQASTLGAAANLAERGQIRQARAELALMEQTRVDVSEAAIKARAKQIQAADQVSYKAALSAARKEIQARAGEWQAKAGRLQDFINANAVAQRQVERAGALEKQIT